MNCWLTTPLPQEECIKMAKEDVQIDMQEKTQAQLMQNYPQIKK